MKCFGDYHFHIRYLSFIFYCNQILVFIIFLFPDSFYIHQIFYFFKRLVFAVFNYAICNFIANTFKGYKLFFGCSISLFASYHWPTVWSSSVIFATLSICEPPLVVMSTSSMYIVRLDESSVTFCRSFINIINRSGERTAPCGTPVLTGLKEERVPPILTA